MVVACGERYASRLRASNGIESVFSPHFCGRRLFIEGLLRPKTCRLLRPFGFLGGASCLFRVVAARSRDLLMHIFFSFKLLSIVFVGVIFWFTILLIIKDDDGLIKLDTVICWFGCFWGHLILAVVRKRKVWEAGSFWWLLARTALFLFKWHDKVVKVPIWGEFLAACCLAFLAYRPVLSFQTIFVLLELSLP